ncbi:overproduction-induced pheromone-resistant [Neonectria punicea]|uniref:Overproduction-induced pheromone-resistant n=1 Tax=Neonectria punicea TaxID=979145 RepID=A0ABR1GI01_9HYPO
MEDTTPYLVVRDLDELSRVMHLVSRSANCVKCDDTTELECPKCKDGESCQFTVPVNCTQCAKSVCIADDTSDSSKGSSGPSVGGIVGGVLGGLAVIAVATYLVWRFCIKPQRSQGSQSIYDQDSEPAQGSEKEAASRGTRPPSTHTVHSIASTVLTRASNIIQIAYIPGVTNRATPNSPSVPVPPVPPIPMQHAAEGRGGPGSDEQHFFVPGDLRDSTYSGLSGYSDRTSYARTSYAPRSSVASTIYGRHQVAAPAQTGMRAKPTVVSVKSTGSSSLEVNAPPVPTIDFQKFGNGRPKSGASAFSVGSTFLNSANTATQARAQVVKVGGLKKIDIGAKSDTDSSTLSLPAESRPTTPSGNPTRDSSAITIIEDSPTVDQGPFSDPPDRSTPQKPMTASGLGAVIEDTAGETDRGSERVGSSQRRDSSPFGDQHATKE